MKRLVVEGRHDAVSFQMSQQPVPRGEVGANQIEHVCIVGGVSWNRGQAHAVRFFDPGEAFPISFPYGAALCLDIGKRFDLGEQECGYQLRWQERRAQRHPAILVDFAAKESRAVGAFLPDNFCGPHRIGVIDLQCTAFTRYDVLGLVKRECGKSTECAQRLAIITGIDGLRGIFDDGQAMAIRQCSQGAHVACHTGIVDRDDDLRPVGNETFDGEGINVGGVGKTIRESNPRSTQGECVRRRNEGVARDNDFVARLQIAEQCRSLQGICTRRCQEGAARTQMPFKQSLASFREGPVTGQFPARNRFRDIMGFPPGNWRFVERDQWRCPVRCCGGALDNMHKAGKYAWLPCRPAVWQARESCPLQHIRGTAFDMTDRTMRASETIDLPWDSEFFGLRVGRISANDISGFDRAMSDSVRVGFDLLYLDVPVEDEMLREGLDQRGLAPVSFKTVLELRLTKPRTSQPSVELLELPIPLADQLAIEDLAIQAGWASRFRIDERIGFERFQLMYRLWAKGSIKGELADAILVVRDDSRIAGFITVTQIAEPKAAIKLFSVHPDFRRRGYGAILLEGVAALCKASGCQAVEVSTQGDNAAALKSYRAAGFVVTARTAQYHIWI